MLFSVFKVSFKNNSIEIFDDDAASEFVVDETTFVDPSSGKTELSLALSFSMMPLSFVTVAGMIKRSVNRA